MKRDETYNDSRKIIGSELEILSSKRKELKAPKKIFTFSKEYLKMIENEKESLQLQCEITKITQNENKIRFLKFFKSGILYSKTKESLISKVLLFQVGLFAQIRYEEKKPEITSIILILQEQKFEFVCLDKLLLPVIKKILQKNLILSGFHDEFRAIKTIGKGSSATVYLCQSIIDKKRFAAKAISKPSLFEKEKNLDLIYNEISIMRKLSHPNLIHLNSVYETENSFYMILELFQGGNLKSLISKHGTLSISNCTIIMRTMLKALFHLKQNNILHRDIKPENILFRKSFLSSDEIKEEDIVISDFGFAVATSSFPFHHPRCGTPGYVAPEILKIKNKNVVYGHACDMFSLGITFFHMLCGKIPYTAKNGNNLIEENEECLFALDHKNIENNSLAKELIMEMLEENPINRITVESAILHEFFSRPYDLCEVEAEGSLHEMMKHFNSNRKISGLDQINPLPSFQMIQINNSRKKPVSMESNGSACKQKFIESEDNQSYLSLAFNKPGLNGFTKTYMSILNNVESPEDQSKRKSSNSPNFMEDEDYEGRFDKVKQN